MATFGEVRKLGTLGAVLILVSIVGLDILPEIFGIVFIFTEVYGLYYTVIALRDTSWILGKASIYRNYAIGEILSLGFGTSVTVATITAFFPGSANTSGGQNIIALSVLYAGSLCYAYFLGRSLTMTANGTGIKAFGYSAWCYIGSAIVPPIEGLSALVQVRLLVLIASYVLVAVAFNSTPLQIQAELPILQRVLPQSAPSDMEQGMPLGEKYLGSVASAFMSRKSRGYTLYATDKRLFGVGGGYVGMEIAILRGQPPEKKLDIIRLERKHDFELKNDDILSFQVSRPGIRSGHIVVTPKKGKTVNISYRGLREFDLVTGLLEEFKAGALTVK